MTLTQVLLSILFVVATTLAWVGLGWLRQRRKRQEDLIVHRSRTRRVFGCIACGCEIVPPSLLWRCGMCKEETTLCNACYGEPCLWIRGHQHKCWHNDQVDLELPFVPPTTLSLHSVMRECFVQWSSRRLLQLPGDGKFLTYAQVGAQCSAIAWALVRDMGLSKGDVVVIHEGSTRDFYILEWALFLSGGLVACPVPDSVSCAVLKKIIGVAQPKLIFTRDLTLSESDTGGCPIWRSLDTFLTSPMGPIFSSPLGSNPDDLALLLPTSGSTGTPKLVMFTDSMLCRSAARVPKQGNPMVTLSYGVPLRQAVDILSKGGLIGLWSGSMEHIFDDARRIRPTVFGGMPTFFEALRGRNDLENILGNRCKMIVIGGARSSPELKVFIFKSLGMLVLDGYGSTETGGLTLNGESNSESLMLIDCPALGYLTSDDPPRGEIVALVGKRTTPGYYRNEEATKECLLEINGTRYWRTGDIGVKTKEGIQVIDRARNFMKLSNGCFVAPSDLETRYLNKCPLIQNIFIFADASNEFLLAAVNTRGEENLSGADVLVALVATAKADPEIRPFEIPRRVVVDPDIWTVSNGLLNPVGKIVRSALAERFHVANSQAPIPLLDSGTASIGMGGGIRKLLQDVMNVDLPDGIASDAVLADLGPSSVALAKFINVIEQRFDKRVSIKQIASMTVVELERFLFSDGRGEDVRKTSINWDKEAKEGIALIEKQDGDGDAIRLPSGRNFFLTGATGFVGAYLLRLIAEDDGVINVTCPVRASSDEEATQRLYESCASFGVTVPHRARARIRAISADLGLPYMGFAGGRAAFLALAQSCDWIIIHSAAQVNSTLPYRVLHAANVRGTATMVTFAALSRLPLYHVSTVGLLSGSGVTREQTHVPSTNLDSLSGYAQSKWVAEQVALSYKGSIIFRLGSIAGPNAKDSINLMVRGIHALGVVCLDCLPPALPLVRVTETAAAILNICKASGHADRVFHIVCESRAVLQPSLVFDGLKPVSKSEWFQILDNQVSSNDHPLFFIRDSLRGSSSPGRSFSGPTDENTATLLGKDWITPCTANELLHWSGAI